LKDIAKSQKGGNIGKDILKRQGAQGGILLKPENNNPVTTNNNKQYQECNQYLWLLQADKEWRQMWLSQLIAVQAKQETCKKEYLEMVQSNRKAMNPQSKN